MNGKDYYWDEVSQKIGEVFLQNLSRDERILEVVFSCGHFLEFLHENLYTNLSGIEIRKEQFEKTKKMFLSKNLNIPLSNENFFNITSKYDAVFSTGLIQCFSPEKRDNFISHLSKISNKAVLTVPKLEKDRNLNSNQLFGVAGCKEYKTSNICYELSMYYRLVREGEFSVKNNSEEEIFLYYICKH